MRSDKEDWINERANELALIWHERNFEDTTADQQIELFNWAEQDWINREVSRVDALEER